MIIKHLTLHLKFLPRMNNERILFLLIRTFSQMSASYFYNMETFLTAQSEISKREMENRTVEVFYRNP